MRSKQKQLRKSANKYQSTESLLNKKIVSPEKLKILVLAGNDLLNDHLQFLQKCISLIKLDISHNHITKLPDKIGFENMKKLQVMQLHYNKIANIEAIQPIFASKTLIYVTCHHNPIENNAKSEHIIINMIPTLKLINNRIVYIQERSDYFLHERPFTFVDSDFFENWKSTENSQSYYLKVLNLQLQFIDNVWTFKNPIIFIQRAWKHFLPERFNTSSKSSISRAVKSKLASRKDKTARSLYDRKQMIKNHPLKTFFDQWKTFSQGLKSVRQALKSVKQNGEDKDKRYLLEPLQGYFQYLRNMRVKQPLVRLVKRIRRRIYEKRMASILISNLKSKYVLFEGDDCFYHISKVSTTNKFYYNRNQQHLLDNFLANIAEIYNKREIIYSTSQFRLNKQFNAIRLVDPQSYINKYGNRGKITSICSFIWPSMRAVVVNRKKTPSNFKAGIIGIKQLSYIKNRDKVITKNEYNKSIQIYRRLQKFAQNQYEDSMWEYYCPDETVMKLLFRFIYYHNTKSLKFQTKVKRSQMLSLLQNYEQPFIFYVQTVMRRTSAAVAIQKTWRRYISNKNQKESIYMKMKKNRAALHIQYFFRQTVFRHRSYFSKKLYNDLAFINTSTIIYPLELYLNLPFIYNKHNRGNLYSKIKITKKKEFGVSQEFYRPIFSQLIRETYFGGKKIGVENYETQIDIYQLVHHNSQIKMIDRGANKFLSFTYASKVEACIIGSLISLFTYQKWGKYYIFPLTREYLDLWQSRIKEYRKIKGLSNIILPFSDSSDYLVKQIRQKGVFVGTQTDLFEKDKEIPKTIVNTEFYQKVYHNFPHKHKQKLILRYLNVQEQTSQLHQQQITKNEKYLEEEIKNTEESHINLKQRRKFFKEDTIDKESGFLNITMIDKNKINYFDHSQKAASNKDTSKAHLRQLSKTAFVTQQNRKQKVIKVYKDEIMKRQAQRSLKQTGLAALRQKAKQQKAMNTTIKNMKQLQRTENLRSKVNRVKEFKMRANSTKRQEQSQFIQQNNFVMEQQMKMMIMRSKMKELQHKKQENSAVKKFFTSDRHSQARTIQSRKSSKQRVRVEDEEILNPSFQTNIIGDEGSIINVKKKVRKPRANSIGAYIRDPSFVHGVFPQQYYPIQSRSTSFYFPPVI